VRLLLAGVDIETQAVAIHYYVDDMTLEEVAATLGRSVPIVRKCPATFAAQRGAGAAGKDPPQGSMADD
jgi:RNA polymerase sigma-70 factor, ECF subfamily